MPIGNDVLDEEDMPPVSSAGSELDATIDNIVADANAARSSDAASDEGSDTISVIRNVIGDEEGEAAETEAAASSAEAQTGAEGTGDGQSPDDAEYSDVPFNAHPRFRHLLGRVKNAEEKAGRFEKLEGFLDAHDLEPDEATFALTVAGLSKMDPAQALQMVRPWIQQLAEAAGEILPPDLQQRVQDQELTRDAALEVSRARAAQVATRHRETRSHERQERTQVTSAQMALRQSAQDWIDDRAVKDPHWADKQVSLKKELLFIQSEEGVPTTAVGVQAQLKKAYEGVNATFRPARKMAAPAVGAVVQRQTAQRPATRPVTSAGGVPSTPPAQAGKPKSTLDIIKAIAGQRGQ